MNERFTRLVCNLLPSGCRFETLEDREHIVVPMVILTEGVHAGSMGPLYYPNGELSKTPEVWNHKPIVVYHPSMNGQSVSACDPVILNSRKVGVMLNTKYEKGKLKSEAWIEKTLANKVDDRVMTAIENKQMMELSTGVFIDVDDESGSWKEEEYVGVARNFRPDHLALLPDQIGACSIKDGAGFLRNQRGQDIRRVDNEMSFSNVHSALCKALKEKFPDNGISYAYICDVYADFFIYDYNGKLWRLGYAMDGDKVTVSDEAPVEVVRATEYRTVDGAYVGNRSQSTNQNKTNMNKKEMVDAIITANAGWAEADRESLMALNEGQLKLIQSAATPKKKDEEDMEADEAKKKGAKASNSAQPAQAPVTAAAAPAPAAAPAAAQAPNVVSIQDYIRQAPKEMQEVLNNSLDVYNAEKVKLIDAIIANKNNAFTKEDLNARPLNELRNIARLAVVEVSALEHNRLIPNYAGQAPVIAQGGGEEPLEVPVLNFTRNGANKN